MAFVIRLASKVLLEQREGWLTGKRYPKASTTLYRDYLITTNCCDAVNSSDVIRATYTPQAMSFNTTS